MMHGHFAALSFKYTIDHVLSFTNIYYLLSNSQRQMLCYYMTHILRDARSGSWKNYFSSYIFLTKISQSIIILGAQNLEYP